MSEDITKAAGAMSPAANLKEASSAAVKSAAETKLEKELDAAKAIISAQNAEMNKLIVQVGSRHTILTVDGVNYKSLAKGKITVEGKTYDAADLNENLALVKELIEGGSGLFIKVKPNGKAKKGGKK